LTAALTALIFRTHTRNCPTLTQAAVVSCQQQFSRH
jgi:hypothetical protein